MTHRHPANKYASAPTAPFLWWRDSRSRLPTAAGRHAREHVSADWGAGTRILADVDGQVVPASVRGAVGGRKGCFRRADPARARFRGDAVCQRLPVLKK